MGAVTFTLSDLLYTLLILAGIAALIALAVFLLNLVKTLKKSIRYSMTTRRTSSALCPTYRA